MFFFQVRKREGDGLCSAIHSGTICYKLGHTLQQEAPPPSHQLPSARSHFQKVHTGICVTGSTQHYTAGARAGCQFGERESQSSEFGLFLPLHSAGFSPDSPHFSLPLFSPRLSTYISSSHSPTIPCLPSWQKKKHQHAAIGLHYEHMHPSFAPSPPGLFLAALLHPHQWARASLQLNRNLIMRHAPLAEKLDRESKSLKIKSLWYGELM